MLNNPSRARRNSNALDGGRKRSIMADKYLYSHCTAGVDILCRKSPLSAPKSCAKSPQSTPRPSIYDEAGLRRTARGLLSAFAWNKGYREYYAVKACPNPFILQILKEEGQGWTARPWPS